MISNSNLGCKLAASEINAVTSLFCGVLGKRILICRIEGKGFLINIENLREDFKAAMWLAFFREYGQKQFFKS